MLNPELLIGSVPPLLTVKHLVGLWHFSLMSTSWLFVSMLYSSSRTTPLHLVHGCLFTQTHPGLPSMPFCWERERWIWSRDWLFITLMISGIRWSYSLLINGEETGSPVARRPPAAVKMLALYCNTTAMQCFHKKKWVEAFGCYLTMKRELCRLPDAMGWCWA